MESTARDARRRRIVDRGSDRLAFITGQARSPPLDVPSPPPPQAEPDRPSVAVNFSSADSGSFELPKPPEVKESTSSAIEGGNKREAAAAAESEIIGEIRKLEVPDEPLNFEERNGNKGATGAVQGNSAAFGLPNLQYLTAKKLGESVSATENIRLLCALVISMVAVLSFRGYPGKFLMGITGSRPLVLILLTDAAIVLGHAFLSYDATARGDDHRPSSSDKVAQTVEAGLVTQQAVRSFFMDCSICAVVMICGFAF